MRFSAQNWACQLWLTLYVTTFFDVLRDKYPDLTVGYLPYSSGRARREAQSAKRKVRGAYRLPHGSQQFIMAASIRAGQSWDLRLPYASLRVTLRVGTQKQPTFMHLLTGLRLQHPQRGSYSPFGGAAA